MARDIGNFFIYYNAKEQESLVEKFGTTDKKELQKLIKKESLIKIENSETIAPTNSSDQLTTKEKLEKVKLANETLKIWNEFRTSGFSLEQLEDYVNNGVMPYMDNPIFPENKKDDTKPIITFGTTIRHTSKKIKQEDGTLRCLHCSRTIPMRAFDFEQLDDYRKHVESTHEKLDEAEITELMEIYPR